MVASIFAAFFGFAIIYGLFGFVLYFIVLMAVKHAILSVQKTQMPPTPPYYGYPPGPQPGAYYPGTYPPYPRGPQPPPEPDSPETDGTKTCPACKMVHDVDDPVCPKCGYHYHFKELY